MNHFSEHPGDCRGVLLWSLFILLGTVAYITFGISLGTSVLVVLLALLGTVLITGMPERRAAGDCLWIPSGYIERCALIYVVVLQTFLLWMLWSARTDIALQTPWYNVGISFFLLFAFESTVLFWVTRRTECRLLSIVTAVHFFLVYGAALVVFRYGYGYDPIIHQAAEDVVVRDGRIFPLQPFYIGQYAIVAIMHHLTQIPVWFIDRALLPVLACVSVPFVAVRGLVQGYGIEGKTARLLTLLIPILATPFLTFTVPYNLTILLLLWWVLLAPCIRHKGRWGIVLVLISGAAAVIHPLVGVPLVLATLFLIIACRWRVLWAIVGGTSITLSLLVMLGTYRLLHGVSFVTSWKFWEQWPSFFELFALPFSLAGAPWSLVLLYRWEQMLPWIIVVFGCIGLWRARTIPAAARLSIVSLGFGLLGGMYLLRTMIDLPGIVSYEQAEFVLRLRETIPIIFLPSTLLLLSSFISRWMNGIKIVGLAIAVGALLTMSWYVMYPQVNDVSWRVGWNVQKADAEAVQAIEKDAVGKSYVVFSDRVLAAVALREFGFTRTVKMTDGETVFFYALEPDKILFSSAEKLLYYGLTRDDFEALRRAVAVDRLYIAIHEYWYRVDAIAAELRGLGGVPVAMPNGVRVFMLDFE